MSTVIASRSPSGAGAFPFFTVLPFPPLVFLAVSFPPPFSVFAGSPANLFVFGAKTGKKSRGEGGRSAPLR